jgi:hypothetical protein
VLVIRKIIPINNYLITKHMETSSRPTIQPINVNTLGANQLIAANPSQYIYIKQIALIANGGANTVTLQKTNGTTTTSLSILPLKADGSFIFENTQPDYPFWIDIEPGYNFQLSLSAGTAVTGHIIYGYRK